MNSIDKNTLVPISLLASVIALLSSIGGGCFWMNNRLTALEYEIKALRLDIARVQASTLDRWTQDNMATWAELLQAKNPSIDVPKTGL